MQERIIPTLELIREEVLPLNPLKYHQQREATTLREDKNKNRKRNPETRIIGKKGRKLSKKKYKLEKLHEVPKMTSQEAGLQALNLVRIAEPRRMGLHPGEAI
jgi:hypothetical protein